jgi:Do/DeqQ family serine protease
MKDMNTKGILKLVLVAVIGGFIALFGYSRFFDHRKVVISAETPGQIRLAQLPSDSKGNPLDFTYAADRTIHAVVHVKTTTMENNNDASGNPLYDFFFGNRGYDNNPQPVAGFGSGVIISNDGYIVTNNHVVDKAENIEVTLNDKRNFKAKVIGRDPDTDLAVIKIDAKDLPYITYGNSDALRVGEWVLAVGNPYNLTSTVTAGIVSAKNRNLNILSGRSNGGNSSAIESFIQTDAAVNPGNSGGALVNTKGEMIGITTAIASPTGSYSGNSFAVPVTIVKKVVADLIEHGKVQRAMLGVSIQDIDDQLAKDKNIDKLEGVYVAGLAEGGSAQAAGVKEGDVILSVNGTNVNSSSELQEEISRYRPNDKVELVLTHENKKKQISVTLRNMEGTTKIIDRDEAISVLGAQLGEVSSADKSKLGIKGGAKVLNIGQGKLRSAGVQKDFIITTINNQPIGSVDEVKRVLSVVKRGVYLEGVYPNGVVAYYAFGLK